MKKRKWLIIIIIIAVIIITGIITALIVVPRLMVNAVANEMEVLVDPDLVEEAKDKKAADAGAVNINELMENQDFIEVFNNFYFPESEFSEVGIVDEENNGFYIILDTDIPFEEIETYYRDKNIQSVWRQSHLYETNEEIPEGDFTEGDEVTKHFSKLSFYNDSKDKIVNILIKEIEDTRNEIVIIFWELI